MYRICPLASGLNASGRAALWLVLQQHVVKIGALRRVGLTRPMVLRRGRLSFFTARQCFVRIDHETMCIVDEGFCNGLCMSRGERSDENTLLCLDPRRPIETKNDSQSVGRRWMFDGV